MATRIGPSVTPARGKQRSGIEQQCFSRLRVRPDSCSGLAAEGRWTISISTVIQIMACSPPVPNQTAIWYSVRTDSHWKRLRAEPSSGWELVGAADFNGDSITRTTFFTRPARVKPRSGISTTTLCWGELRPNLFRRAGA